MEVILAGFNLDIDIIDKLKKGEAGDLPVTPETLSAAYARISRYPQRVDQLREKSRTEVEKARKSNRTIIFEMGHHSVAEHAVFNFDIIGLSRLAVEALQNFRLASYTEKSQRYITLKDDYLMPREIVDAGRADEFRELIESQNRLYHSLFEDLKTYYADNDPVLAESKRELANRAKEDARYVASLATHSQLGMTVNARELELMIRRFASHPLKEVRELGTGLYENAKTVAPSILLFCAENEFDKETYPALAEYAGKIDFESPPQSDVTLVDAPPDGDLRLLSALLHRVSSASFESCRQAVEEMTEEQRLELVKIAFQKAELFNSMLREFEHVNLTYEVVCSASCYAQLKRHRLASLSAQAYDLNLGYTVPRPIVEIRQETSFRHIMEQSSNLYNEIGKIDANAACYALTNAHRRRILVTLNARELYHFSRLRSDSHAQWEIQEISNQMIHLGRMAMPVALMLTGGKDAYPEMYAKVFGHPPKVIETELPGEAKIED